MEQVSESVVESHGLTPEEYRQICQILGRTPNLTELGIFSVMWSEHCSYKSSRVHLAKLPTRGPQVIQGPGENAGVVDIGDGLAAVFKMESHNHPSFIEPYQGAATGVGGIIRDIFTMGARPIALMNSLHFGPLEEARSRVVMEGVVAGIAGYGNCMGIPTVGGEVYFHPRYNHNPIINVFCLGVAPANKIFLAEASGVGNPVIYVGAKTGRDGIHGATMASEEFKEGAESKRPNVQIGDPFLEKLLLEACLEAMKTGAIVGIQDMGAAGLTCSTCEMGSHAGVGIEIELDLVPQREAGMTPYEIMLSESQERMLLVAEAGREREVLDIFEKWELDAVVIGRVRDHGKLVVQQHGETVAEIPNRALTEEAPLYQRPEQPPTAAPAGAWDELPVPSDYSALLSGLLASPHLCSRLWIYRQYDHQVRTNTVVLPGSDAAVLRLDKTNGALALSVDGNPRFCALDPRRGAMLAVAESCRNLVCSGARPLAATNCLNFASPENPVVMWQFREAVEGMGEACEAFGTPITGGNVSFYNETDGRGILPTPVLGMLGKIDSRDQICDSHFKQAGDLIYLLGQTHGELGGSIYAEHLGLPLLGPCPQLDLQAEKALQETVLRLHRRRLLRSAHDLSEGGLLVAVAESCFRHALGATVKLDADLRPDHFLLSESASRILVSVASQDETAFLETVRSLPCLFLGRVNQDMLEVVVNGQTLIHSSIGGLIHSWESTLEETFRH